MGKKKNAVFHHLFFINLLYANPPLATVYLKKEAYRKEPQSFYKKMLVSQLIKYPLLFVFSYALFLFPLSFELVPYYFDYIFAFLLLMDLMQTFPIFFNTFYESKDLESYMPLPLSQKAVFAAKLGVVAIVCLQTTAPIFSLFLCFFIRRGMGAWALLATVLLFTAFYGLYLLVLLFLMQALAKVAVFSKIKSKLITSLNVVGMLLSVAFIFWIRGFPGKIKAPAYGGRKTVLYGPLSFMLADGIRIFLSFLILLFMAALLYLCLRKGIEQNFYAYIRNIQNPSSGRKESKDKKREESERKGRKRRGRYGLFRYNLSLIGSSDVITQYILSPMLVPIILWMINYSNINRGIFQKSVNPYLLLGLFGFTMGTMICFNWTSLPSIILSLDRENYDYLKSFPISRKKYFMVKWAVCFLVLAILPTILLAIATFLLRAGILAGLFGSLILWLSLACGCIDRLIFDAKHLLLDWQSVSQLAARSNRWLQTCIFIIYLFVLSFGIITFLWLANSPYYLLFLLLAAGAFLAFVLLTGIRFLKFMEKYEA